MCGLMSSTLLCCRSGGPEKLAHSDSIKVDVSSPSAAALKRLPTAGRRRSRVQQRLADIDTDHDGVITKDELVSNYLYHVATHELLIAADKMHNAWLAYRM